MAEHKHDTFGKVRSEDHGSKRVTYHTCSVCGVDTGVAYSVKITGEDPAKVKKHKRD